MFFVENLILQFEWLKRHYRDNVDLQKLRSCTNRNARGNDSRIAIEYT